MDTHNLLASLGQQGDDNSFGTLLSALGTVALPGLDEEDPDQLFDWVLIRSRGLEIGFADAAYFYGNPYPLWRSQGLVLQQITFYNKGREGITPYDGDLPYELRWSDTRDRARERLSAFESIRKSYLTDCWDIGPQRFVLAYKNEGQALDSVRVSLRFPPLPALPGVQPSVAASRWFELFGLPADSDVLRSALAPLDLRDYMEEEDDDGREIDCRSDAGLILYFEQARQLSTRYKNKPRSLVLGAVKFFRARDLDARQYQGELPFGLRFEDTPEQLEARVGAPPAYRKDSSTTGSVRWHFDQCSLQILYSTIENFVFRVTLMAPGYWREMSAAK